MSLEPYRPWLALESILKVAGGQARSVGEFVIRGCNEEGNKSSRQKRPPSSCRRFESSDQRITTAGAIGRSVRAVIDQFIAVAKKNVPKTQRLSRSESAVFC